MITIVVPVLNEEANIQRLYSTVNETMQPVADRYRIEFLFTDNHSTDRSFELLSNIAATDSRVRVLRFSRNFGYQRSILTGYLNASGEAVIQLDCDLQDPPAMILEFLAKWEVGYKVIYGVRKQRREGVGITLARKAFYRLINWLSDDPLPLDAGDFRLVDRRIVEVLRKHQDATPYLRGQIAAMGFRQIGLEYSRSPRLDGESKFGYYDLINLAIDGILNHSPIPLRLAKYVSQAAFVVTCIFIAVYASMKLTVGTDWTAGFATLAVLTLSSICINSLLIGIQGEYIARIYKHTKQQPLTIIEESVNGSTEWTSSSSYNAEEATRPQRDDLAKQSHAA
ncbi:glycosyltransferase family 2 protein [Blastopirellula marina]|uniref:glycosyltransferase family 2 protein n=1 Tax=Blastopirellula marina TaxID=124 RepID=UPI0002DD4A9D|nr:glycosyltransferase family 2 protein [Blastopirellula marina]